MIYTNTVSIKVWWILAFYLTLEAATERAWERYLAHTQNGPSPCHWGPFLLYPKMTINCSNFFFTLIRNCLSPSYFTGFQRKGENIMWFLPLMSNLHPTPSPIMPGKAYQTQRVKHRSFIQEYIHGVLQWWERGTWVGIIRKVSMGRSELEKDLRMNLACKAGYGLCQLIFPIPHSLNFLLIIEFWFPLGKDSIPWPLREPRLGK